MKFFRKLKNGNFWISLISAGVLIAEGIFDFEIKTEYLNQILLGLMGILTLFGIVTDHGETNVILNQNTTEAAKKDDKTESVNTSVSNIKSICDTVSLLLNKVSINSNLDVENVNDIINEVKEINEVLHKENEKEENIEPKSDIVTEQPQSEVCEEEHKELEPVMLQDVVAIEDIVKNEIEEISIVNN